MRVVSYVRVSTQEQADSGWSLPAQERRIRAYCESRGWTLERLFVDAGISSTARRPQFEQMLDYTESHMIGAVVVLKLDRLHRDTRAMLELYDRLEAVNCAVVSITEGVDSSTPFGRFTRTILAAASQLERELISERTIAGLQEAKKNGVKLGRPRKVKV